VAISLALKRSHFGRRYMQGLLFLWGRLRTLKTCERRTGVSYPMANPCGDYIELPNTNNHVYTNRSLQGYRTCDPECPERSFPLEVVVPESDRDMKETTR